MGGSAEPNGSAPRPRQTERADKMISQYRTLPSRQNRQKGFNLLELMVTLAIIGVLAAIAIPNYSRYLAKGHRSTAQSAMLDIKMGLEKSHSVNHDFCVALGGQLSGDSACTVTKATDDEIVSKGLISPSDLPTEYYSIVVEVERNSYKITATAKETQSKKDPLCAEMSVNSVNMKLSSGAGKPDTSAECW